MVAKKDKADEGPPPRVLADDLFINRHDLPTEWENHPHIYMYWAEEYTYAVIDRDKQKDQVELTFADLDGQIRLDPDAHQLEKVTDKSVAEAIKRTQTYQDEVEKLHQSNLVVNRMAAARSAMDHKRKALDAMTTLLINQFYNSNTVPSDGTIRGSRSQQRFTESMDAKDGNTTGADDATGADDGTGKAKRGLVT